MMHGKLNITDPNGRLHVRDMNEKINGRRSNFEGESIARKYLANNWAQPAVNANVGIQRKLIQDHDGSRLTTGGCGCGRKEISST